MKRDRRKGSRYRALEVHEKAAVVGIGLIPKGLPEDCIECALKSWEVGVFVRPLSVIG